MQWVGYKSNDKTKELLKEWWGQTFSAPFPTGNNVGFLDFAWEMVSRGFGYTFSFLPDSYKNDLGLTLTPLSYADGSPVMRTTWFVYPDKPDISKELLEFAAFIREEVGK